MKFKTNAGEVELTAEMVCRGMVFAPKDPRDYCLGEGRVFVVGHRDEANGVWRDARDENLGTNVFGADRLLGCDPIIASRADCERFGVHGDAGAHGFARLRDGGAVDLTEPNNFRRGMVFEIIGEVYGSARGERFALLDRIMGDGNHGATWDCSSGASWKMWKAVRDKGVRFIGLDARHASPEGVRRLCCGEYGSDQIDGGNRTTWAPQCTLAIGDHDMHEDLATGAKWSARKVQFYDRVDIHLDGKPLREDLYPRRLAALADGISGDAGGLYVPALPIPTCGCCGKATEPSRIGPTMLVLPVGDCLTAEAPICRSCLVDVNEDIAAWTIRDGKIERKVRAACPNCGGDDATCRGSLAGLKACAAKGAQWGVADIVSGKALDGLALLYDEKRRAGETCEDLRARLRGLRFGKDTGNGFRVGGPYVHASVDPAQPEAEATALVSAVMRKAGESLAAVGEAAKRCAESAMLVPTAMRYITSGEHAARGFCAFVDGLKRWAALCSCGAIGPDIADNLHAAGCRTVRARREAPLVALVNAVPEGLDPIGWRAAVLAVDEAHPESDRAVRLRANKRISDPSGQWLRAHVGMPCDLPDWSIHRIMYDAYHRAITPAPKVPRVRATWKTRGPVLPCDNGWDE